MRRELSLFLILAAGSASAALPPEASTSGGALSNFDVRGLVALAEPAAPTPEQLDALAALQDELRGVEGGELVVHWGPQPGTFHHAFRRAGFLTGPAAPGTDAEDVARAWLRSHHALLGLSADSVERLALSKRFADPGTEAVHLHFQQRVRGLRIFHGEVRVHLDRHGRVLSVGGDTAPENLLDDRVVLDAEGAFAAAARQAGLEAPPAVQAGGADERGRRHFGTPAGLESEAWADELWFPHDAGLVRAWRVIVDPAKSSGWYQVVVDARDGSLLSRHDMVQHAETQGLAFREDPSTGPQLLLPFVDEEALTDPASPLGWTQAAETRGNNCDVKDDLANDNEGTEGMRAPATGDPLTFDHSFNDDPNEDLLASITNLFYLNNWLHDRLVRLGFDAPAGNFQEDNFGLGGRDGDSVYVDAQDGGGRNNANFGTPPDGSKPRMQMYVWTRTNPNRDSGFDASVVTHELFHGVSNRLVGGADEAGCLGIPQGGAMGEAWSDFFPCSFWDTPVVGAYVSGNGVRGIRRWAYDQHPLNYGQLCNAGGFQVHRDGEIWAATLWGIRELFVDRYGFHAGKCRIERLVLDGMKLAPCRPTYTDMRDAILLAARLSGAAGDECLLWQGFAARGLGIDAVRRSDCTSDEDASFDAPAECAACALSAPVLLDLDASEPNRVTARFTPDPAADEHVLLRSSAPCPGMCFDAEFVEVARGPADAVELVDADAPGNRLSAGQAWSYRVMAVTGGCTAYSECAEAAIAGRCTLEPVPAAVGVEGVLALERPPSGSCSMTISWADMASSCGDPAGLVYNVYRSDDPAFEPGPQHLVASVPAPATEWLDDTLPPGSATYVVRAEDLTTGGPGPHGGNEELNGVRLSLAPQGAEIGLTDWLDDVESGELEGYRRTGFFTPNEWAVVSDGNTRGGSAWHVPGAEGGTADSNLVLPRVSLGDAPAFRFQHTFKFENDFDGGVIEISTDGGRTWTDLLDDIVTGGYATSDGSGSSRTVGGLINAPNTNQVWTGQNGAGFGNWETVEVDLSAYAGTLDAQLRLRALFDPLAREPEGWYVDDLEVGEVRVFDDCTWGCLDPPSAVIPAPVACLEPDGSATVLLDASGSAPGAAGWADGPAIVFSHDGAGRFAGGGAWEVGPTATLIFPPGTGAGAQEVLLTLRGADGCRTEVVVPLTLEDPIEPPGRVGATLKVARQGTEPVLGWDEVGAERYNAHVARPGEPLTDLHLGPAVASGPPGLVLEGPAGEGSLLFIKVFAASSCGLSWP